MTKHTLATLALSRHASCLEGGLTAKEATRNVLAFLAGATAVDGQFASLFLGVMFDGVSMLNDVKPEAEHD